MLDLLRVHINIDTAQTVDHFAQSFIAYGHKVRNIHIQIHVQHLNRLLCSAIGISGIAFLVGIRTGIQVRITIYADQFDITGIHVDAGDHDTIASAALVQQAFLGGVHTEQGNVHIALHSFILLHLFGNLKFFCLQNGYLGALIVGMSHYQIQ